VATIDRVIEQMNDITWWQHGSDARADAWTQLRDEAPVLFGPEPEIEGFPRGPGFWSVTRHADVVHVSRHPELFCSGQGTNIPDLPVEIAEFFGSMINMDAPKHTRLRMIVNRSFTPRMVARIDADVRRKARGIVADVAPQGSCDVVAELAAPLPLQIICEMMGIPRDSWQRVFELTNIILGDINSTPDLGALMGAAIEMAQIAQAVGEDRLADPRDDLVSAMMHAEVDGESLEPMEMASFFILLAAAGNETTVIHFRRTATADTRIGEAEISAGDKVVMWYESADRDPRAFDEPTRFDVTRSPNDHLGFGAGGPHFCLGANLARREIRVMFEELFRWIPDIHTTGDPTWLTSPFIHGITALPAAFTPTDVPADALSELDGD
jgi:cytochrome P450